MSGHCPGSTRLAHACPGPPSCSSLPSSSLVDGWLPCRTATESRPHLARIAKREDTGRREIVIYLHEKKRSDVEYHPSPGKFNSLLFSSCGLNRGDVDRCRVHGAYLDLNDPSGKKHDATLWAWQRARVRRKNKPISPAKHRRRPACLLRMSMKIDSVLRTIAFLSTPHALEERFHFRRPIALPCPGTAHRPGCLQAQAPSVFRKAHVCRCLRRYHPKTWAVYW